MKYIITLLSGFVFCFSAFADTTQEQLISLLGNTGYSRIQALLVDDSGFGGYYKMPLIGIYHRDFRISNYYDSDNNAVDHFYDYTGGLMTYDGHDGVDLTIRDFYQMDTGVDVVSARAGVVHRVHDGEPDRNTSWDDGLVANAITIVHRDGTVALYAHLKKYSILPKQGDIVAIGQKLGEVGSSGRSTNPHLHFEVFNSLGATQDIFANGQGFPVPYPYDPTFFESGASLASDPKINNNYWQYPPIKRTSFSSGTNIRFWAKIYALDTHEEIRSFVTQPNGDTYQTRRYSYATFRRSQLTWFERSFITKGQYRIRHQFYRNGLPLNIYEDTFFTVY